MVLPGHLAGGYLITRSILLIAQNAHVPLTSGQVASLTIIGTLAGEAPDIDLLWYSFKHLVLKSKENDDHREYVTHAPLAWLVGMLILIGIGFILNNTFIEFLGLIILAGSWTHFLFDSIEHGVVWLWPFSRRRYYLRETSQVKITAERGTLRHYWEFITKTYVTRATFYVEIAVTVAALAVLIK